MKHPVLKIKKGAVVYDDTAAREFSEIPHPALPGKSPATSRRRKRRSAGLTYFPLVIIAVGLFILFRIVPNTPVGRAAVSGWQATLHVTPHGDRLIVGVTFLSKSPLRLRSPEFPEGAEPVEARVRFSLAGTGEQQFVAGDLVKSPMTLRGELPWVAGSKKVQAEVSVGSSRATLWRPVPDPAAVPSGGPTTVPSPDPQAVPPKD